MVVSGSGRMSGGGSTGMTAGGGLRDAMGFTSDFNYWICRKLRGEGTG